MVTQDILKLLSADAEEVSYTYLLYENKREKWTFIAAFVLALSGFVLIFLNLLQVAGLIAMGLALILVFVNTIWQFARGLVFFKSPAKYYVKRLCADVEKQEALLDRLSAFSEEGLTEARELLLFEQKRLKDKMSFLVGALEKIGFVPLLVSYAYALYQFAIKAEISFWVSIIVGLSVGFFFTIYVVTKVPDWQRGALYLLQTAIQRKQT